MTSVGTCILVLVELLPQEILVTFFLQLSKQYSQELGKLISKQVRILRITRAVNVVLDIKSITEFMNTIAMFCPGVILIEVTLKSSSEDHYINKLQNLI